MLRSLRCEKQKEAIITPKPKKARGRSRSIRTTSHETWSHATWEGLSERSYNPEGM